MEDRPVTEDEAPLLSRDVLDTLEHELEDPTAYLSYVTQNRDMWPDRHARLSAAIRAGDYVSSMDAVLSLRTASQMVGAPRLAELALDVERALLNRQWRSAEGLLDQLEECGIATMAQLEHEFSLKTTPPLVDSDWSMLSGNQVEVRFPDGSTDSGIVDEVTPDGLIMWLKQDGAYTRRLVEKLDGVEVYVRRRSKARARQGHTSGSAGTAPGSQ